LPSEASPTSLGECSDRFGFLFAYSPLQVGDHKFNNERQTNVGKCAKSHTT